MILDQAPTAPDRVPVSSSQFPGPLYWRSVSKESADDWDTTLSQMRTSWEKISMSLRTAMVGHIASGANRRGQGLNIIIGQKQFLVDQATWGFGQFAGVYMDPRLVLADFYPTAIIHEFGHHIDWHLHDLWPGASMPSYVSSYATFKTVLNRATPTIPSSAYARTNQYEWFAEAFASQHEPWDWRAYVHNICGGSEQSAVELRMAFKDAMPMPDFAGGRFDSLPTPQAPSFTGGPADTNSGFTVYGQDFYVPPMVPTPGNPATPGTNVKFGTDGILFTGYPWPTFAWEVNLGSGWQSVSVTHSNPVLYWTVQSGQPLNPQFRCTATNIHGSATTPIITLYTTN